MKLHKFISNLQQDVIEKENQEVLDDWSDIIESIKNKITQKPLDKEWFIFSTDFKKQYSLYQMRKIANNLELLELDDTYEIKVLDNFHNTTINIIQY